MKTTTTAAWGLALILCAQAATAQDEAVAEEGEPFFGLNVGAKGLGGADVWTDPANADPGYLLFADTLAGWGAGGGLYAELRVLWGHLGLEIDLLFERNRIWHEITWNEVLETEWSLEWTSMRLPLLLKGCLESGLIRACLCAGPEFVVGLGADDSVEITSAPEGVPQAELDQLEAEYNAFLSTEKQTDTYFDVGLGLAVKVWRLAITLDLRAGFNLTQPEDHDDRIRYTWAGSDPTAVEIIASSTMDFRLLLGVAWEHGFDI
jgi:hypothetical protein